MPPSASDLRSPLLLRRLVATAGVALLVGLGACSDADPTPGTEGGDRPPDVSRLDPEDTPDDPATIGGTPGQPPGAPPADGDGG